MNGFSEDYTNYSIDDIKGYIDGYCAGISRAINKLVELGKIDVTEAAELMVACINPEPDPFDVDQLFAKKTTP